jgi:hypothetical protein
MCCSLNAYGTKSGKYRRRLQSISRAYQIVIKATANAWLPLSFQYETHRVLQPLCGEPEPPYASFISSFFSTCIVAR